MSRMWMVRASGGRLIGDFLEKSIVGMGFRIQTDLSSCSTKEELREVLQRLALEDPRVKVAVGTNYIWRFISEVKVGDRVITYDKATRTYLIGNFTGEYQFDEQLLDTHPHIRAVKWAGSVSRDALTAQAKNPLGSMNTIFLVPDEVAEELELKKQEGVLPSDDSVSPQSAPPVFSRPSESDEDEDSVLRHEVADQAREFVKDIVVRLGWDDMQELVAGILRAMGYKTRVSAKGADRGRDIVASPDGLGLEQPRIVVEVKHRQGSIGAPAVRSFLGGLSTSDRGLYVSTGGYTKEARYEADRASPPVTLLDLDELVELLTEHYENADQEVRTLVPLTPIYWPVR